MKKIGIYGGSFDPVHSGHVAFAQAALEILSLTSVTVLPAAASPFKSKSNTGDEERLAMCRAAFPSPAFTVSDHEIKKGGKSYTVETLQALKEQNPDSELYLLLGSDQFLQLHLWYRYKEILKLAVVAGAARDSLADTKQLERYAKETLAPLGEYRVLSFEPLPISSTQIRNLRKQNKSIHGLVPEQVEEIILQKGLYQNDC